MSTTPTPDAEAGNHADAAPGVDASRGAERSAERNIAHTLSTMAREHGGRVAFVVPRGGGADEHVTFAQLDDEVSRCAGALRAMGVTRGDRIVVFVPMSRELYVIMPALFRLGAVAVFIDPWGGRAMIDAAAALVEPTLFIGVAKSHLLRLASPNLRRIPRAIVVGEAATSPVRLLPRTRSFARMMRSTPDSALVRETAPVSEHDGALITFTTGTTGTPKGANRTHGFLTAQHATLGRHLVQQPGDVHHTNLPIFVLHNLGRGVTTLLSPPGLSQNAMPDGARLHELVRAHDVSILTLSPAPVDALARASETLGPLPGVRRVYTGGGPVLPTLCERAATALPNADVVVLYGSTECEPIGHCSGHDVVALRDQVMTTGGIFVGWEVDETDVRLIAARDEPIELAPGQSLDDLLVAAGAPGEVLVAGDHVNRDYFRNDAAFRENKLVDEAGRVWHRTGDMARRDRDGGLWLLGRLSSAIELAGRVRYPFELETPLGELTEIARAAVCNFAGEDDRAAVLVVEPAPGATPADALRVARDWLANSGLVGAIELSSLSKIPVDKRHATKIDMPALRAALPR